MGALRKGDVSKQAAYLSFWRPAWPLVAQGVSAGVRGWDTVIQRG